MKNVKDALDRHADLDTLVGIWAYNAHAIVEVVKQRNLRDKVTVVVFDAAPKAIGHMTDGNIDAMVVQNPYDMGYRGTRLMKALGAKGSRHDSRDAAGLRPREARRSRAGRRPAGHGLAGRASRLWARRSKRELFAPSTEFLSLSDFKQWLSQHNLTGS